jgi:heme-degrading monooxygenase HmoA
MHAMIQRYVGAAPTTDELVAAGRRLGGILDGVPGFISCVLLRVGTGRLTMVSLFEDQASLEAAGLLDGTALGHHLNTPVEPTEVTTGEVVFQKGL